MAVYLTLLTLTAEGRKKMEEYPEWLKDINKEVEFMGVKILAQYALLGQYDFVNIIEAPSDQVAAKLAIHMSSRGGFQTLTLTAIPLDELIATLKKKTQQPF